MKRSKLNLAWMLLLAIFAFASCEKDDDGGGTPLVEDGVYVFGAGTGVTEYTNSGLMKATNNEVGQVARAGLYELYIAVEAGDGGFNIGIVTGGQAMVYGPGADFAEVLEADKISDEPRGWFARGSLTETTDKFTVPESGLYHVIYDQTLNKVAVARVEWGIIGGATVAGWGGSTALPLEGTFSKTAMTFKATEVILTTGDFKFRYSNGWKIVLDGELVRVNTNFGGAVDALVPGGDNISNTVNGYYTIKIMWTLEDGTSAEVTKTADYTPPSYPDAMYIAGAATAYGWPTVGPGENEDAIMHKCAGGAPSEGIFWKICYLEANQGFKLSAANWGNPNLGFAEVTEFDANGVTVSALDGNMSVATSGMYMIVLNLRDNLKKVSIIAPEVYGIGDAFGGYTEDVPANKFTIDNVAKTLVSPAATANGNLRSYVNHAWIPSWWNAEFVVNGTDIEYRNDSGSDPTAVALTAGQIVTYHFDDNTGTITTPVK